jgi:syntaxin 16
MATRNLTSAFLDTRDSRASSSEVDSVPCNSLPPVWVDTLDHVNNTIEKIKGELRRLDKAHSSRLQVTFTNASKDTQIERLTSSIISLFKSAEASLKTIATSENVDLSVNDRLIRFNAMRNVGSQIQELNKRFRKMQSDYGSRLSAFIDPAEPTDVFSFDEESGSSLQVEAIRESEIREKEILNIARSINELANLFRELNQLIIDQGTLVDRIDYNVERAYSSVKKGTGELAKAEVYSRRSRTALCGLGLFVMCVILSVILWYKHR